MFKIILFMQGSLAIECARAATLVFGEQDEVEAYPLELGCDVDVVRERIKKSILDSNEKGQEVLALTDLMNGTPFNTMMQLSGDCRFRHFTGTNFPLLLEVLNRRMSQDMDAAVSGLAEAAKNGIYDCDTFLEQIKL